MKRRALSAVGFKSLRNAAGRFRKVISILADAVSGKDVGAHGEFWRDQTRDKFVAMIVSASARYHRRAGGRPGDAV